jgi:hypothetical protein
MTTSPVVNMTTHEPIGQLVEVDGHAMHLHAQGEGTPTVIMEAAIWDVGLTWSLAQSEVATITHMVVYDRAGLGWSEPSHKPRTAADSYPGAIPHRSCRHLSGVGGKHPHAAGYDDGRVRECAVSQAQVRAARDRSLRYSTRGVEPWHSAIYPRNVG